MDVCPVSAIDARLPLQVAAIRTTPKAVDTICTLCSRAATTAWLKAKPEWAKGARLIRFTPRFNPDVNGYWMCDIGRFQYHWVEGEDRLRRPLALGEGGFQQPMAWHDIVSKLADRLVHNQEGLRFLLSAHASNEEFFLFRRLTEELAARASAWRPADSAPRQNVPVISVGWRHQLKSQPAASTFKVPPVDAPNVNGARSFGFVAGNVTDGAGQADLSALRAAVEGGQVAALYVFDPGPAGSIGDTEWILQARARGVLPLLIVQGVLLTHLARAADFVLPGASWVEKEASYTNDQGRLQGATRAMAPPGEALEDWQILIKVGAALGVPLDYPDAAHIRADIAARYPDRKEFAGLASLEFGRPVAAQNWLQASNPSERWKWDFMFQDLPPVKGSVDPSAVPLPPERFLKEVK